MEEAVIEVRLFNKEGELYFDPSVCRVTKERGYEVSLGGGRFVVQLRLATETALNEFTKEIHND